MASKKYKEIRATKEPYSPYLVFQDFISLLVSDSLPDFRPSERKRVIDGLLLKIAESEKHRGISINELGKNGKRKVGISTKDGVVVGYIRYIPPIKEEFIYLPARIKARIKFNSDSKNDQEEYDNLHRIVHDYFEEY